MPKKFKKIVLTGKVDLSSPVLNTIQKLSEESFDHFPTAPKDAEELVKRIDHAEAVLCGWGNSLTREVLERSPSLKYLGMCGTNLDDIDLNAAKERGITVTNVVGYSDASTAEFIFTYLLSLMRGLQSKQWRDVPTELNGKILGIIGMGGVGTTVASLALSFGMRVIYFSRTRKPEVEKRGASYVPFEVLLRTSDIISLHVSRNTNILSRREFNLIREGTIFINTAVGRVFDEDAFFDWIRKGKNFVIMDNPGTAVDERTKVYKKGLKGMKNVIYPDVLASRTQECQERLSRKVLENLKSYLSGKI